MEFYIRKLSDIFFSAFSMVQLPHLKGEMRTEEWQDDIDRCVQCENKGGRGGCYAKTKGCCDWV